MEAVVLYSSVPSNVGVENDQRALLTLLRSLHVPVVEVDGASAENKELRSKLFALSGKRAVYPQLFARTSDSYTFIGDWAAVSEANELKKEGALSKMLAGLVSQ